MQEEEEERTYLEMWVYSTWADNRAHTGQMQSVLGDLEMEVRYDNQLKCDKDFFLFSVFEHT